MKKSISVYIMFLIFFSCSKKDNHPEPADPCSHISQMYAPVTCNGSIGQTDTCKTYLEIWKELFLSTNQMTQEYFNSHITLCAVATYKYAKQGIQFELSYKYKIDWFEVKFDEGFMILLDTSYLRINPTVNLPANVLLSKDQISAYINNSFFADPFHKISSINHLNYASEQDALNAMANAAGVNSMCLIDLYIQYENVDSPSLGHPLLTGGVATNWDENKCVSGTMDLASDYLKIYRGPCFETLQSRDVKAH
jgi:hypothetical protein